MYSFWQSLVLTFVPLFIVIDTLGNLPIVISMSEGLSRQERLILIHKAMVTATLVGLVFLFFGRFILDLMGISVGSFAIAGGLILLILSIRYMMTGRMLEAISKEEMIAIVPIGTPLVVGPATITTLLLLAGPGQNPVYVVLISFLLNMALCWGAFLLGDHIAGFMGEGGLKAVSRIFDLILAAIAVSMILRGLEMVGLVKLAIG